MGYSPPQPFTTPDGRTVSFPPEFAAQFQGLMPVQPPAPAWQPEPQLAEGGGGMTVQPAPPAPPPPVAAPTDDAALMPPEQSKPPPPVKDTAIPRPRTDADLGKIGQAGALNASMGALDQQAEAGRRAADVEAAGQQQAADAYAQRNLEIDAEVKQRQADAEEKLRRVDAATADANTAMKAYADHKVSREVDHPILAAIGLALGAVGSAMKGSGDNPAMTMLMQQLDKKVQLQLADRDKLKDVAGMKKQAIDQVRQAGDDKIAMRNLAMAGETEKAIRRIEEIKARTSGDSVRVNAEAMVAGLRERQAALLGQAVNQRLGREDAEKRAAEESRRAREQIGLGYFNAKETRRHNMANEARERERDTADFAIKMAAAKGTEATKFDALDKEVRTLGIYDSTTGKPILDVTGQKMQADAAQIEARAKSTADPAQAKALADQAASLRATARLEHTIKGRTPEDAAKASGVAGTAQNMLAIIDGLKAKIAKSGTKVLNANELQATLETELSLIGLEVKDMWTLGSLDDGAAKYMNTITGSDPSKLTASGVLGAIGIGAGTAEQSIAKLNSLGKAVERKGYSVLAQHGVETGTYKFARNDEVDRPEYQATQELLKHKTPVERGNAQDRGFLGGAFIDTPAKAGAATRAAFTNGGQYESPEDQRRREAESNVSKKYPGLAPEQENPMDRLLQQARGTGEAAANAKAQLVKAAAETAADRPEMSNAVLNILKDADPALYRQALAQLPEEQRTSRETTAQVGRQGESLPDLETRASAREPDAVRELQRRANATPGGPAAKAFMRVLKVLQPGPATPGGR